MKTEIEIPVAELKAVLSGFSKVVSKRATLPILGCVKISLDGNKAVQIQANNLDEIVTARLGPCSDGSPGEMVVSYDELTAVVKHCASADSIRLLSEGKNASIRYQAAGAPLERSLSHMALEEWPPSPEIKAEPLILDGTFKQAIREAFECASTESSRYILNGACLDVSNKGAHYVVGTDGHHLYSANSFLFDIPESLIIPTRKFIAWPGFMDDGGWILRYQPQIKEGKGSKVGTKPAWVRLDSDHWTYVAKAIEGAYPNWRQAVPSPDSTWTRIILGEPGVKTILETVPLLPGVDRQNQPVVLEINAGQLILKAKGKDKGEWSKVAVDAKIEGPPVEVSLNRIYLTRALRFGTTWIDIKDPVSPLVFSAKGKSLIVTPLIGEAAEKFIADQKAKSPPAVESSPAQPETEERKPIPMPENNMTLPPRGNLNGHEAEAEPSALEGVFAQFETIKIALRKTLDDMKEAERLLRKVASERKVTDKEISKARTALRSLQAVEL